MCTFFSGNSQGSRSQDTVVFLLNLVSLSCVLYEEVLLLKTAHLWNTIHCSEKEFYMSCFGCYAFTNLWLKIICKEDRKDIWELHITDQFAFLTWATSDSQCTFHRRKKSTNCWQNNWGIDSNRIFLQMKNNTIKKRLAFLRKQRKSRKNIGYRSLKEIIKSSVLPHNDIYLRNLWAVL